LEGGGKGNRSELGGGETNGGQIIDTKGGI